MAGSLCLAPLIGRDFFPTVDSGQMRLHARAPAGTRIEKTEQIFAEIEDEIRQVIPPREIENIIDNIGIPNGGFNLAFGDSPTLGVERRRHPDFAERRTTTAPPPTTPTACASACTRSSPTWCSSSKPPTSPTRF